MSVTCAENLASPAKPCIGTYLPPANSATTETRSLLVDSDPDVLSWGVFRWQLRHAAAGLTGGRSRAGRHSQVACPSSIHVRDGGPEAWSSPRVRSQGPNQAVTVAAKSECHLQTDDRAIAAAGAKAHSGCLGGESRFGSAAASALSTSSGLRGFANWPSEIQPVRCVGVRFRSLINELRDRPYPNPTTPTGVCRSVRVPSPN